MSREGPEPWEGVCMVARRSAQPLLPGPFLSPSPRPGLSWLLFPFSSLPPPSPNHTQNKATSPPPKIPPTFAFPPSHLSGAHRNCRPGGSSGRPPSSLLAFSSLTGEGRPEEGEARSRSGRRSGRSARSCFPAFQREKKERGTSGLRARRRRRRPLYRAALPGARATPASASMPPPPPPAPRFPRAAPHSASSSHAAAQGYRGPAAAAAAATGRREGLPARGRAPPSAPPPVQPRKKVGGRTRGLLVETPGDPPDKRSRAGGKRPPAGAFLWDSFLGRPRRPSPRRA